MVKTKVVSSNIALLDDKSAEKLEEELLGQHGQGKKSDAMERNLHQMISVLKTNMNALENVTKLRKKCLTSYEEINSAFIGGTTGAGGLNYGNHLELKKDDDDGILVKTILKTYNNKEDNLVSSEGIFIDPVNLLIRTKAPTETAKMLENRLFDMFGDDNLQLKGKKKKFMNAGGDKSKKSEQQKVEAKRLMRQKLEKDLTMDMESYVTRSVMDRELKFHSPPPDSYEMEVPEVYKAPGF